MNHNEIGKILKEIGIADHLTYLLRNLYAGQEATVRTGHGKTDWFQIGKGVQQDQILSPCLTYMQHTSCKMLGSGITGWSQDFWAKHQKPQICKLYYSNGRK